MSTSRIDRTQLARVAHGARDLPVRLVELDGARGIGVLLVVTWHYFALHIGDAPPDSPPYVVARVASLAAAMMDMFFVVSGFLIGGIVLDQGDKSGSLRVFYVRRAARILPAYLVLLLASLVLRLSSPAFREPDLPFFEGTLPWWSFLTFTQNILQLRADAPGPLELSLTWTLAVEAHFYLLMPLLILITPRRHLPWALLAIGAGSAILRWWYWSTPLIAQTLLGRADPFCLGVLVALAARDPAAMDRLLRCRRLVLWLATILLLVLALTASRSFRAALGPWVFTLWGLAWAAVVLLLLADRRNPIAAALRQPILVWLGTISYGLYLYHWLVRSILMTLLHGSKLERFEAGVIATLIAAFVLSILAAAVSYSYLERPLVRWGHTFRYGDEAPAALAGEVRSAAGGGGTR